MKLICNNWNYQVTYLQEKLDPIRFLQVQQFVPPPNVATQSNGLPNAPAGAAAPIAYPVHVRRNGIPMIVLDP